MSCYFSSICTHLKSSRATRFVDCSWEWLGWSEQGVGITLTGKGIAGDVFEWTIFWIVLYSPREDSSGALSCLQRWHKQFQRFRTYFKRKTSLTVKKIFIRIFYRAQSTHHPASRAFLLLARFCRSRERLCMNRVRSLLNMRCTLPGYSLEPKPNMPDLEACNLW